MYLIESNTALSVDIVSLKVNLLLSIGVALAAASAVGAEPRPSKSRLASADCALPSSHPAKRHIAA